MAKIDINPITGAPIVTGVSNTPDDKKTPTSDFVAQVQTHIDSSKTSGTDRTDETKERPDVNIPQTIPETGPGNPAPQHQHLIDSAKRFNESLNKPPATYGIPYPIQMNMGIEALILAVLRDNGMDTQQQEKAMARIAEILSTAKQREHQ